MKLLKILLIGFSLTVLALGSVTAQSTVSSDGSQDVLYSCNCGPGCECNAVSNKPGNCPCGVPMQEGNVIKEGEKGTALCQCGNGCKCGMSKDDPAKCACGKELKRVANEDNANYVCNCGKACNCNYKSEHPGKCSCGKKLKKSDY